MFFVDLDETLLHSGMYYDRIKEDFYSILEKKYGVIARRRYKPYRYDNLSEEERGDVIEAENQASLPFYRDKVEPFSGADNLLKYISENYGKPHIITGSPLEHTRVALTRLNLIQYVSGIYSMDGIHTTYLKLNPECYLQLAKLFDKPCSEMVLIDNEPKYCKAAKEAGWVVYGVMNKGYYNFEKKDYESYCDRVFEKTEDVYNFLRNGKKE